MGNSNWDFGELDSLFSGEAVKPLRKEPVSKPSKDAESWMSPDEWYWRAADRMLDAHRKSTGLKPITAYRRAKDVQAHLEDRARARERESRESQENEGLDDNVDRGSTVPVVVRGTAPSGF